MNRRTLILAALLTAAATIGLAAYAPATRAAAEGITKDNLGPAVREYLLANPEVVIEAVEAYQKKQEAAEAAKAQENLKTHGDFLYQGDKDSSPEVGNPKATVTIVEFFDYNCGYCKRALKEVQAVLADDKDVRFVFKDMPILSPQSQLAAHWALAAHRQGKYFEFHQQVMTTGNSISEGSLTAIATELGLDVEKMKKDAADPKIAQTVMQNVQVASDLGIRGTPAFIINDRVIGGYIELDEMKNVIAEVRAEAKGGKDARKDDGKSNGKDAKVEE